MKKILCALAALAIGVSAMADTAFVRVNLKSGEPMVFTFDEEPEISMLGDGISVTTGSGNSASFLFDEVESVDFSSSSEVESLGDSVIKVATTADSVNISNVPAGTAVKLFDLNGRALFSTVADGQVSIRKSDYPRGVYVMTVGDKSFKLSF